MKKARPFLVLLVLLGTGVCLFFFIRSHRTFTAEQATTQGAEAEDSKPVAQIQTASVERRSLSEKLTAYGSVVAQPGRTHLSPSLLNVGFNTSLLVPVNW
jgi:hypothetical protein